MLCDYNLLKQSIFIILRYIKSLNNLIYALQALKCPACIYASYINNGVIFIIVTVSHTTCWAGLLWLPVREGSGHVHTWCKLGFSIVFTFCSIQEKGSCITAWDGLYFCKMAYYSLSHAVMQVPFSWINQKVRTTDNLSLHHVCTCPLPSLTGNQSNPAQYIVWLTVTIMNITPLLM